MTSRLALIIAFALVSASCSESNGPTGPGGVPSLPAASQTARYSVAFQSTWSSASHPIDFPENAHYSGLIGGTHNQSVSFWRQGSLATDGIRQMAERGSKSPLDQEVMNAIASGGAQYLLSGPALDVSPGTTSMEFDISQSFPLVTLVTMVAPSPDWFVGVTGLELLRNGQWVDRLSIELSAHDAGTDGGRSYRSPDQESVPREPIRLLGYPATLGSTAPPFGTFTFTRLN